jgi:hypothetical protein
MCVIGEGESATLLKGGYVRLLNGRIYHLSECDLKGGGRLVLSMGESYEEEMLPPKRVGAPKVKEKGVVILGDSSTYSFLPPLSTMEIPVISEVQEPPPPPPPVEIPYSPFAVFGGVLLLMLKKVAGLDRQLKAGTCELRHKEAIVRIAKLEGKVLRKQITDGAKTAKGLKEKMTAKNDEEKEDETKPV